MIDKGKFVVGGGGQTEEEEEEARDTESKTRTPHKVVGKNTNKPNTTPKTARPVISSASKRISSAHEGHHGQ